MTLKFALAPSNPDDILYTQAGTPTLDLRLASSKSLVDHISGQNLIDFTRGGNGIGSYFDAAGTLRQSVVNLKTNSESIAATGGFGVNAATLTSVTVQTPIPGLNTASLFALDTGANTGNNNSGFSFGSGTIIANETIHTQSIFVKMSGATIFRLRSNVSGQVFDIIPSSGAPSPSGSVSACSVQPVGDGWFRIAWTFASTSSAPGNRADHWTIKSDIANGVDGFYVFGAQLEQSSTVGEYVKTTSSISGAPRFDHNPVTGESLGLFVEEQRTNLLLRSEEFDNASWIKSRSTASPNATTAPNGTLTADRIVETVDTGKHVLSQFLTVTGAATWSVYAKADTRSVLILNAIDNNLNNVTYFNLQTGAVGTNAAGNTSSIVNVGNGWYRCIVSRVAVTGIVYHEVGCTSADNLLSYTGDGTSGLFIWGAQLEAGAFPTSYIPTTTAAVTRNADVASITGTNFSRWYSQSAGTVFTDVSVLSLSRVNQIISLNDGTSANRIEIRPVGAVNNVRTVCVVNNVTKFDSNIVGGASTNQKLALAIQANNFALQAGSSQLIPQSNEVPVVNRLFLNYATFAGGELNGHIRRLAYFDRRLPNATLQAITSSTTPTVYGNLKLDNGTTPAAIAGVSPTLDYRFAREKREIETVSLTDKLTYTGGNGTFVGSDGFIQPATTNVPRFDHDPLSRRSLGLLSEVERTNSIRNNTMVGAVAGSPGTLPTNWTVQQPAGITREIVSTGIVNGISYIDFRLLGNPSATGLVNFRQEPIGSVTALADQSWTYSTWVQLASGSFSNLNTPRIVIDEWTSGGAFVAGSSTDFASIPTALTRLSGTRTLTGATTAAITGAFRFFVSASGTPVDITLRIGFPQLELGATASTPIPTSGATVTRTADSAVIDGTGVLTGTYTMVEKPAGCAVVSGTNINLQPGFTAERVMVFPAALDAGQITAIRGAM